MSDLLEAAELLDSPLIWSADMDSIRWHLAGLLRAIEECRDPSTYANDLAETLLDEHHNDISLG
jgi:hypothetical protein